MKKILDKAVEGVLVWGGVKIHATELQSNGEIWLFGEGQIFFIPLWEFILSHDFLKAFFGYEPINSLIFSSGEEKGLPAWQYHGMQLVLSTDRKKYLERFI